MMIQPGSSAVLFHAQGNAAVTCELSGCVTRIIFPPLTFCNNGKCVVPYCGVLPTARPTTHFEVQVHHVAPVQAGHSGEDLLGQPDHVLLREGLVVVGDALVEDFATGGAGGKIRGGS